MKLFPRSLLAVTIALSAKGVIADDTYLHVFLNNDPLQGLDIGLNGEIVDETDARGAAGFETPAGQHVIDIIRDGVVLTTFNYDLAAGQDAEVSINYSDESSDPTININKFDVNDLGAVGFIGGVISDPNGVPLAGARIESTDGLTTIATDSSGAYEVRLPRGEYSFVVSHPDFADAEIDGVRVFAEVGTAVSVKLDEKVKRKVNIDIAAPTLALEQPIEEVLTYGVYQPLSSAEGIERFSTNVVDAIDADQLARYGDSNIAIALTRLVGVSVTEGQYANVRGLDGRYISSSINGFLMPSTDPMRRDVQLDLFPAGMVESIDVQKSYSPNLLGSTTGGAIGIQTKGIPEERVASFSVKVGGNSDVTGKEIITYEGSNTDWLTYDSGLRTLSQDVLDVSEGGQDFSIGDPEDNPGNIPVEVAPVYAVTFEDDYNVKSKDANPDFGISASYGDATSDGRFGAYIALNYDYSTSARIDAVLTSPFDVTGEYQRSTETYSIDGYLVLGSKFRDDDEILSKTMVLRDSENTTRLEDGIDKEDNLSSKAILQWVERQFFSQQFTGKHLFDFGFQAHQLDWRLAFSNTHRYEPDRRSYEYLSNFLLLGTLERRWAELDEDSVDVGFDYSMPFEFGASIATTVDIGFSLSDKERVADLYRFGWVPGDGPEARPFGIRRDENLEEIFSYQSFADDNYRLDTQATPTDSYESTEEFEAYYLNTVTEIADAWTISLGVRQEDFTQELVYPNQTSGPVRPALEASESLPALSLTFAPNDSWQFRAGASRTVSYPGLIERSESSMFDPQTDERITGNPNLKYALIDNLDFRVEYYFSDAQSVSLAFFNKEMENPIEKVQIDGSGSVRGFTFRNALAASLNGVEIDGNVRIIDNSSWQGFLSGNVTFIESEVELDGDSVRLGDEQGRELQGQSPWLANLQFGLDHFPTNQKFTVLLSAFDDRIRNATRNEDLSPLYELGRTSLNLNYEKEFGDNISVKAKIKNLLNEKVEYRINDIILESYSQGTSYSIDVSWKY
jgi:outer membrane receptor protein involved in Fe transport